MIRALTRFFWSLEMHCILFPNRHFCFVHLLHISYGFVDWTVLQLHAFCILSMTRKYLEESWLLSETSLWTGDANKLANHFYNVNATVHCSVTKVTLDHYDSTASNNANANTALFHMQSTPMNLQAISTTMPLQMLQCFKYRWRQRTCQPFLQQCQCKYYKTMPYAASISIIFATACNLNVQNWVLVISNDPKESLPWFSFHAIVCSDRSSLSHLTMIITGLGL